MVIKRKTAVLVKIKQNNKFKKFVKHFRFHVGLVKSSYKNRFRVAV